MIPRGWHRQPPLGRSRRYPNSSSPLEPATKLLRSTHRPPRSSSADSYFLLSRMRLSTPVPCTQRFSRPFMVATYHRPCSRTHEAAAVSISCRPGPAYNEGHLASSKSRLSHDGAASAIRRSTDLIQQYEKLAARWA